MSLRSAFFELKQASSGLAGLQQRAKSAQFVVAFLIPYWHDMTLPVSPPAAGGRFPSRAYSLGEKQAIRTQAWVWFDVKTYLLIIGIKSNC